MTKTTARFGAATLTVLASAALVASGATAANAVVNDGVGVADDYYGTQGVPFVLSAPGILDNDQCAGAKSVFGFFNFDANALALSADGSLTYTPDSSFAGAVSFDYSLGCDGVEAPAQTHVTIVFSPAAPVGAADFYSTEQGVTLSVPAPGLLANDTNGVAVVDLQPLPEGLNAQLDGSFVYTPPTGFVGDVNFSYRLSDGSDTFSDWIPVTISVTPTPVVTVDQPTTDPGATHSTDAETLANTGETSGWLLAPAVALLTAGAGAMLYAGRRREVI